MPLRDLIKGAVLITLFGSTPQAPAFFPNCSGKSLAGKAESLFTPIRYYGAQDRRGHLSDKSKTFNLTKAEVSQIKKSFGFIHCRPDPNKKGWVGSAFLAGNNCEIWTVGHNVLNEDGSAVDLKNCVFQNFQVPGERSPIDSKSPRNIVPWLVKGDKGRSDRARLRLETCIPGAKPFQTIDSPLPKGSDFISVMADNYDIPISNEPILSPGKVEDDETLPDGSRILYTSSDGDKGGSGGMLLLRSNGHLAVRGMHVSMSSSLKTLKPDSPPNGAPWHAGSNTNTDLELSGPVLRELKAP